MILRIISIFVLLLLMSSEGIADTRWESSEKKKQTDTEKKQVIEKKEIKEKLKESSLERDRLKVITETLSESPIPLRTPDAFIRVMILPYTDENNILHTSKYVFIKVEEGQWVVGDYLFKPQSLKREVIFTPLIKATPDTQQQQTQQQQQQTQQQQQQTQQPQQAQQQSGVGK